MNTDVPSTKKFVHSSLDMLHIELFQQLTILRIMREPTHQIPLGYEFSNTKC
jgi:hypothetical protein